MATADLPAWVLERAQRLGRDLAEQTTPEQWERVARVLRNSATEAVDRKAAA